MARRTSVRPARRVREALARPRRTALPDMEIAEAELQIVYDSVACGLIVLSADWQILRMNPAAEATLGWRLAEVRGCAFRSLWSAMSDQAPADSLRNSIVEIRRHDGQRRWLQADIVHADGT